MCINTDGFQPRNLCLYIQNLEGGGDEKRRRRYKEKKIFKRGKIREKTISKGSA
jgi:hypothetical protein